MFALLLLSGCWGSSEPEPEQEAKELRTDKDPLATEVPEAELVLLSKRLYQVGMYSVARDSLSSLKDRYPMGAYAAFAELKHADSFFFNHEYDQAAKLYEDYLKNYPAGSEVPYAKLQAARSHVASARTEGRDRQPWERALVMYDGIITSYPQTAYAEVAQQERGGVILELSAYDRDIVNFYRKTGNSAAVEDRERRFKERWGARLTEVEGASSSRTAPVFKNLQQLTPVVFVPRTQEVASVSAPDATKDGAVSDQSEPKPLIEGRIVVQEVHCSKSDTPFATIELSRIPEPLLGYETSPLSVAPEDGVVVIKGTGLTARQSSFDCFGTKDLEITQEGDVQLASEHPLSVSVLSEPPRLLLTLPSS